jgi:hypothetical protein
MNRFRQLLSPDDASTTGTAIPPPPSGNQISIPRAEYDAFIAAKSELERVKPLATEAETLRGKFSTLFSKTADPSTRASVIAEQMRSSGYTQEEIDAHLGGSDESEDEPAPSRRPARDGRGEPDETTKRLAQEVATMGNALRQQTLESTNEALQTTISTTLDGADALQKSLQAMSDISAEARKVATDLVPTIQSEARQAAIALLGKKSKEGVRLTQAVVKEVTKEATTATIRKYELIIGQASRIGKAPQMDEFDMDSAPVPTPKFDPVSSRDKVEAENTKWAIDKLMRDAASLNNPTKL